MVSPHASNRYLSAQMKPAIVGSLPADTPWVATHKYHGTNFMIRIGSDGSVAFGRRNGFLTESQVCQRASC